MSSVAFENLMQVSLFVMLTGKLFHSVAAAYVKVPSPYVTVLVRGTVNLIVDSDRRELIGL